MLRYFCFEFSIILLCSGIKRWSNNVKWRKTTKVYYLSRLLVFRCFLCKALTYNLISIRKFNSVKFKNHEKYLNNLYFTMNFKTFTLQIHFLRTPGTDKVIWTINHCPLRVYLFSLAILIYQLWVTMIIIMLKQKSIIAAFVTYWLLIFM